MSSLINSHGMSPEKIFWTYHTSKKLDVPTPERCSEINQSIHSKVCKYGIFKTITYSPKPPKRGVPDDIVYKKCPELQILLPRVMTLVFDDKEDYITDLIGCRKFSGKNSIDDDEESDVVLFSQSEVQKWAEDNECIVDRSSKANGKLAATKLFNYNDQTWILFGTKNVHHITSVDKLKSYIDTQKLSDIILSIGEDVNSYLDKLLLLLPEFSEGFSLLGELEDGQHFTPGDNKISWFGLYRNGISKDTETTLSSLRKLGLRTVECSRVFSPGQSIEEFQQIYLLARCVEGEGDVLVFRNTRTLESCLCKNKSPLYILKRMFRQKWLGNPVHIFTGLMKRVCEASDYHGLNTHASIKITKQLFKFAIWLGIVKNYPKAVLGHQPINSIRGTLPNGFNIYWEQYITETDTIPVIFKPEDFGDFNYIDYNTSRELIIHNTQITPIPKVVFLQGIQGDGKSTIASQIEGYQIVEQDVCYGDTSVTQFVLLFHLMQRRNVIISRCNAEPKQYSAYLKIAQEMGTHPIFVTTNDIKSPMKLAIALAGVLNRSNTGDQVLVGRKELPFQEVVDFTTKNWKKFKNHPNAVVLNTWQKFEDLEKAAEVALLNNCMAQFVLDKKNELMNYRLPLENITEQLTLIIDCPPENTIIRKNLKDVNFIGLHVIDSTPLIECVKKFDVNYKNKDSIVCGHLTQIYLGKKSETSIHPIPEGEYCLVNIDALVINEINGASAFRVKIPIKTLDGKLVEIASKIPHITAVLSNGSKATDSNKFVFNETGVIVIPVEICIMTVSKWL